MSLNAVIPSVSVPEGISGHWSVKQFTVTEAQARFENLRASFSSGRPIRPGTYTCLMRGGQVVMSDVPAEKWDHYQFVRAARDAVLINGLGLGMVLNAVLLKPTVSSVTVVENSEDVIRLVGSAYANDPRVTIILCGAHDYQPPKGARYGAVWHDIWDDICADNLAEMGRLHRKYGRKTDWQGSWAKELCQMQRERGR